MSAIKKLLFLMTIFSFVVACAGQQDNPEELLLGQWKYISSDNGDDAFQYDIEFLSDGKFIISGSPFLEVTTFDYWLLEGNRIKLTAVGSSEVFRYGIDGDELTLFFENGYNLYSKISPDSISDVSIFNETIKPDSTPTKTSTIVLQSTNTPTLVPKPTETETPTSQPQEKLTANEVITKDNLDQLVQLESILAYGDPARISFSSDGSLFAVTGGSSIKVFSYPEMKEILTINEKSSSSAFSPVNNILISGYYYEGIYKWDLETGELLLHYENFPYKDIRNDICSLAFSPNGRYLVIGPCQEYYIYIYDFDTKKVKQLFSGEDYVENIIFSHDGQIMAHSGASQPSVYLFDTMEKQKFSGNHTYAVKGIALSPDGTLLATSGISDPIKIWEVNSGNLKHELFGHTETVLSLGFSPNGELLASADQVGYIRIWDVSSGKELLYLVPETRYLGYIKDILFTPDGKMLMAAGDTPGVLLWGVP
jgi:WD40 repeat protein